MQKITNYMSIIMLTMRLHGRTSYVFLFSLLYCLLHISWKFFFKEEGVHNAVNLPENREILGACYTPQ